MLSRFLAALVVTFAFNAPALADASGQGCSSSGGNAAGCTASTASTASFGTILAAPAPLAGGGILGLAVGLAVFLKKRGGKKS